MPNICWFKPFKCEDSQLFFVEVLLWAVQSRDGHFHNSLKNLID